MFNKELFSEYIKAEILGKNLLLFDKLDSTNTYLLENDFEVGTVAVANNQINGKGRSGRSWFNSDKGLAFSVVLPILEPKYLLPINIIAGFSVIDALKKYVPIKLKWPNDCVINGKKVCGILIDTSFNGSILDKVVLGIGLNIDKVEFPIDIKDKATFLNKWSNVKLQREFILAKILNKLENYINLFINNNFDIVSLWKDYSDNLDKEISIHINGNISKYVEKGINYDGCLIVINDAGKEDLILSGEIGYDFSS